MEDKITLLGKNLSHSYSPAIHNYLGKYEYTLSCVEEQKLDDFFRDNTYKGFNVTIPYKIEAFERCASLSKEAKEIGSVNTCVRLDDGSIFGDNTDYYGFCYLLDHNKCSIENQKVLILGSGGSSKTVQKVVSDRNAKEIIVISRNGKSNYETIYQHYDADIIVNTTPVGMFPNPGVSVVDISKFEKCSFVFDLIYNPFETQLIIDASKLGKTAVNGLEMLVAQAKRSSEIFNNTSISDDIIPVICEKIKKQYSNIVLIGMPGCGKSTIGSLLSKALGKDFIDTDNEIEKTGINICDYINTYGESKFRELESNVVKSIRNSRGCVISIGGGTLTRQENINVLKENGLFIYLECDVDKLSTQNRPISVQKGISVLYEERHPIFSACADYTIKVSESLDETVKGILKCVF